MDGAADLWRNILGAKKDLEKVGVVVTIEWVRSHLTAQDVEEGKISYAHWVGNDKADKAAKLGAALHAIPAGIEKYYFKELAVSIGWLRYLMGVHSLCIADGSLLPEEWAQRVEKGKRCSGGLDTV